MACISMARMLDAPTMRHGSGMARDEARVFPARPEEHLSCRRHRFLSLGWWIFREQDRFCFRA